MLSSKLMELHTYMTNAVEQNASIKDAIKKLESDKTVVMQGKNANIVSMLRCDQMALFSEMFDFVIQDIEEIAMNVGPRFTLTLDAIMHCINKTAADIRAVRLCGADNKFKRELRKKMRIARKLCIKLKEILDTTNR